MRHLACIVLLGASALACGGSASNSTTGGTGGSIPQTTSGTTGSTSSGTGGAGGGGTASSSSHSSSGSASSSSGSASSSSGSSNDGGITVHGDCHSDGDCPEGRCIPVTPGGFLVCQALPMKSIVCGSPLDQCCPGVPCPNDDPCYRGPLVPICAGVPLEPYNQCAADQCTQDVDCADDQICAPAGTLGRKIRACIAARCKVDTDCSVMPGGVCAPVKDPCCGNDVGLYCVYPAGGCRSNADCPATQYCQTSGDQASCLTGAPICPQ